MYVYIPDKFLKIGYNLNKRENKVICLIFPLFFIHVSVILYLPLMVKDERYPFCSSSSIVFFDTFNISCASLRVITEGISFIDTFINNPFHGIKNGGYRLYMVYTSLYLD